MSPKGSVRLWDSGKLALVSLITQSWRLFSKPELCLEWNFPLEKSWGKEQLYLKPPVTAAFHLNSGDVHPILLSPAPLQNGHSLVHLSFLFYGLK